MADLRYKVVVDDAEARRKLAELLKGTGVSGATDDAKKATTSADDLRAATLKLKDAQLANLEAMKQARLERAAQVKEQAELNAKYKQGQIDAQEYRKEQARLNKEEKERAKAARELKKQLAENSEYAKLTKALNNVRKETKDVLAEMFSLEKQGKKNTVAYAELEAKSRDLVKQTNILDTGVKKIDATVGQHQRNVGNYASALDNMIPIIGRVNMQLAGFGTSLDSLSNKPGAIRELGTAFAGMGRALLAFITTPVGAAIAGLATLFALFQRNKQTVIDFDSGMKNVAKTTGMAGTDLSRFGDAIVDLSMKLKVVSADKLLEYATVAGQLGVKGRADILAFTESLAMLETASDISGEEGGADIARMLTLVDGGVQNVKAFGDEIVNLGNNFAATESEILSNATQISQNVGIYKLGRQEVLAFATATKAVGLEAELVGSTFGRTLGTFEKTIRTGKGVSDILKVVGGSAAELQKRFRDDASGVFVDYIRGLNAIDKAGGSVNAALAATGIVAVRDQRVIASLATNGFDVLTEAMETVRDANGAMQAEFENGASKLEQQSKRMGIAWDNFVLSIENGEGAIGRAVIGIMGFFSELLDQVNKTFNPTSVDEFFARFVNFKQADSIRDINKAMSEGVETVNKLGQFDVSKSNNKQVVDLLKEVESSLTAVTGAYKKYQDQIASGDLKEGGKNTLRDFENTISLLQSQQSRLQSLSKPNADSTTVVDTDFNEKEAEKARKAAEKAQRAAERKAEQQRQAVERQRSLQLSIDALNEQSARKQLSRDQEEIASIKDKYAKIKEEVRKFYADPKNTGLRVNMSGVSKAQRFEISEATIRQGTVSLVKELNEQRQLYDEYNSYVKENGIAATDEMFGKQADIARDYKERLKKEYADIIALQVTASVGSFSGAPGTLTQAQQERAKALREMLDAMAKQEDIDNRQRLANALKQAETFGQAEFKIRKKYADALLELGENVSEEQRAVLAQGLKDDLANLIESSPEFKKAIEDIDKSSQVLLGNAFRTGKETIMKLIDGMTAATAEQKTALKKIFGDFFDRGAKNADEGLHQNIAKLAGEFSNLVESSFQFKDNLDGGLGAISDMVSMASNLAKTLSETLSETMAEASKGLSSAGGAGAIIGAVLSIGSAISTGLNQARQEANARVQDQFEYQNERQLQATEAVTKALERQLDLINEIYGGDRLAKYADSLVTIEENWKDINKQLSGRYMLTNNDTFANDILRRLNNGETAKSIQKSFALVSQEYVRAQKILDNLGQYTKLSSLPDDILKAREELAKLQYQADLGSVDDYTQKLIDQLQAQIDLYDETLNKLREENTGNSFSSLLSDVSALFKNSGEDAADAWSKGFDKIMENYLMQKFSRDYLEERMQGWYSLMDEYAQSGDGIDGGEREALKKAWDKIQADGQKRWDDMQSVLGLDGSDDKSSSLTSGGIARQITEDTGSELVGMFRSVYDVNKQSLLALQGIGKSHVDYIAIANGQLVELNAINANTAAALPRLDKAVAHLQNIDKSLGRKYGNV